MCVHIVRFVSLYFPVPFPFLFNKPAWKSSVLLRFDKCDSDKKVGRLLAPETHKVSQVTIHWILHHIHVFVIANNIRRVIVGDYTHRIHVTGIFAYIYHKNHPNVGKYSSPMDSMGLDICWESWYFKLGLMLHGIDAMRCNHSLNRFETCIV